MAAGAGDPAEAEAEIGGERAAAGLPNSAGSPEPSATEGVESDSTLGEALTATGAPGGGTPPEAFKASPSRGFTRSTEPGGEELAGVDSRDGPSETERG